MFDNQKISANTWWDNFKNVSKRQVVKAKTILLEEGKIADKLFFIESGCLRVLMNNEGKEITFQFYFEGQMVSSFESFWEGKPSLYSIETLETSIIQSISKNEFQTFIENSSNGKKAFDDYIYKRFIDYKNLFLSRIRDNPEKRYIDLLENHSQILQRIPQHYIASYLGITPVSLSRIRNRH